MTVAGFNNRLDAFEQTLGALVPAVAQGAAMIRLIGSLVRGKMSPDQQKQFDQAIAEFDAQNQSLQGAVDRLRAASAEAMSSTGTLDPNGPSAVTAGETTGQVGSAVTPIGQDSSSSSGTGPTGPSNG